MTPWPGSPSFTEAPHRPLRSSRAAILAVMLAAWSLSTEPLYAAIVERRLTLPIGEAVVFAPLSIVLAALAIPGGTRSLRAVSIIAGLLALGEIPAGILATTDPSIWWKPEPECGIVYCGLAHTLSHWSHVPLLVAIALTARIAGAHRPLTARIAGAHRPRTSPDALPERGL